VKAEGEPASSLSRGRGLDRVGIAAEPNQDIVGAQPQAGGLASRTARTGDLERRKRSVLRQVNTGEELLEVSEVVQEMVGLEVDAPVSVQSAPGIGDEGGRPEPVVKMNAGLLDVVGVGPRTVPELAEEDRFGGRAGRQGLKVVVRH